MPGLSCFFPEPHLPFEDDTLSHLHAQRERAAVPRSHRRERSQQDGVHLEFDRQVMEAERVGAGASAGLYPLQSERRTPARDGRGGERSSVLQGVMMISIFS